MRIMGARWLVEPLGQNIEGARAPWAPWSRRLWLWIRKVEEMKEEEISNNKKKQPTYWINCWKFVRVIIMLCTNHCFRRRWMRSTPDLRSMLWKRARGLSRERRENLIGPSLSLFLGCICLTL